MTRANKYNARRVKYDGYTFDSQAECNHYCILKMRQKQGEITDLTVHPKYLLTNNGNPVLIRSPGYPNGRQATFTPDFYYVQEGRGVVIEDVKGVITTDYRLRRGVWESGHRPTLCDEIAVPRNPRPRKPRRGK